MIGFVRADLVKFPVSPPWELPDGKLESFPKSKKHKKKDSTSSPHESIDGPVYKPPPSYNSIDTKKKKEKEKDKEKDNKRDEKDIKERDNKDKNDKDREREKEKDKDRERDKEKDKDREKDKDKDKDRDREKDKEKERDKRKRLSDLPSVLSPKKDDSALPKLNDLLKESPSLPISISRQDNRAHDNERIPLTNKKSDSPPPSPLARSPPESELRGNTISKQKKKSDDFGKSDDDFEVRNPLNQPQNCLNLI